MPPEISAAIAAAITLIAAAIVRTIEKKHDARRRNRSFTTTRTNKR
jgi:hypothetical protein